MKSTGIGIALAILVAAFGAWLWFGRAGRQAIVPTTPSMAPTNPTIPTTAAAGNATEEALRTAIAALRIAQTAEGRKVALLRLRDALSSGSTNDIISAICAALDSGADAKTGLGFKIGGGGTLLETPTLRTWLLDQLVSIDRTAAAAYARVILSSSDSPDEWAVALRNLAHGDTSADATAFLETKTRELLGNETWQRDPSVGYLEAFDTAVYLGGTSLLQPLSDLVRMKDNQAVAHAAFLALDRLVISQPPITLAALNEHPEWMQGHEEARANYFARADVRDEELRRLVENYLLDVARSPQELSAFAGVFPNANFMISHNLLTRNITLDPAMLHERDAAALKAVSQWLSDPRFVKLQPQLMRMQQRLHDFVLKPDGSR